ncbi:MAG: tetratricopeptide repeat protein [Chlorobi bacterium]|nr:tetratricopeptide repeat protein [Chlorobiota bacterium]
MSIIYSLAGLWAVAQTVTQTVQIGDTFMQRGEYVSAYKYYQRASFFAGKEQIPGLYGKMGDASFMAGKYDEAIGHYNKAQGLEQNDSLRTEWMLKKVTSLAFRGRYKMALLEMLTYRGRFTPDQQKAAYYLKGLCYFGQNQFDRAKQNLLRAVPAGDSIRRQQIERLFSKKNLYRPNPKTAKWLSVFVPGLGQLYAGDLKNAANSFILNGLLAYLLIRDSVTYSFWDGFVGIFPWLQRYYTGGYQRAEKIARKKRKEKRGRVFQKIHTIIFAP